MPEEIVSTPLTKSDVKISLKKNVIPITSLSDLGTVVGDIQNQITLLIEKLNNDVSPEFKALMEGYVNKANESESIKVNLEDITSRCEALKIEIANVRETNRNLVHELQSARETLRNLESQLNNYQTSSKKNEEEYRNKIKTLKVQNEEYENKIKEMETKLATVTDTHEKLRQELLDQNFEYKQAEQELISERDSLRKQLDEFEILLKEQSEQLGLRIKEIEYKDALLNQLVKQATTEKLKMTAHEEDNVKSEVPKKKGFLSFWR